MPLESLDTQDVALADAQWQARVDLAAAHRIAVVHGFDEGIFNHMTLRVPGRNDRYYQIPFGLHWSEVTASCLMEVGYDGTLLSGEGMIERSAYCIHAPIHRLVPAAAAVFHTHQPYASALARLEDPRILPIGQTEVGIMMVTAYDNTYAGPAFDPEEGERLAGLVGDKKVLMMASHGICTFGNDGRGGLRLPVLLRAGGAGAALRDVQRAAVEVPAGRRGRGDDRFIQEGRVIWRSSAVRLALRCAEAAA